ncbi:NUDIX domain-containing protein [Methylomonas montana]|uniref:NUDIX hydrolase n=1 Tax=Methylomonas montana TaxID=3058963 RepID=UPI0026592F4B|nr:NUDIX domain-containing protein [Methylomonas montana]WKJ92091.1 NUDIX domain-containing protein [Methylomonas montana]
MHNELLDVVDADDAIIAQRPRREIHANGLRHRAVHILVFNDLGELFLQKRSMKKDLNKGLWDSSAAGHVDAGESYDSCAPRELQEELNVSAALEPLFKLEASAELGMEFIQVYRCRHNGPFNLAAEEIDEGRWLNPAIVDDRVNTNDPTLTVTFKMIWQQFRQTAN